MDKETYIGKYLSINKYVAGGYEYNIFTPRIFGEWSGSDTLAVNKAFIHYFASSKNGKKEVNVLNMQKVFHPKYSEKMNIAYKWTIDEFIRLNGSHAFQPAVIVWDHAAGYIGQDQSGQARILDSTDKLIGQETSTPDAGR